MWSEWSVVCGGVECGKCRGGVWDVKCGVCGSGVWDVECGAWSEWSVECGVGWESVECGVRSVGNA